MDHAYVNSFFLGGGGGIISSTKNISKYFISSL